MFLTRLPGRVEALAPAKLNLFLEILARRNDGYHEIETLMVAITIFDTLKFATTEENRIRLKCVLPAGSVARCGESGTATAEMGDVPAGDENLVLRAVHLLRQRAGVRRGADVWLAKRIPSGAGLGGASSDAAAALLAANAAWQLGWSRPKLARLAAELGSDVPFFLGTGTGICRGRGERIEWLRGSGRMWVVVARPPEGLSTADVYQRCSPAEIPGRVAPLVSCLKEGRPDQVARHMMNRLQPAAAQLTPWIERMRSVFNRLDCLAHQMSGSGTSYFGICRHARHARRVAARLRGEEFGYVAVASTCSTPSQIPATASES